MEELNVTDKNCENFGITCSIRQEHKELIS
jgi:hypothetical protein